jgi:hypothetical protein
MAKPEVTTRPITSQDAATVSTFLHEHLNPRVSSAAWSQLLIPPWDYVGPNHGFHLVTDAGAVVGVYAAVYSQREIDGMVVNICNLAALCVLEPYRLHSFSLIRALLAQPGFAFTDLSPSGNVIAINNRLGFQSLDTSTRLVVNLPRLPRARVRLTSDPATLERVLIGRDALLYRDHRRAAGVEHLLIERDGEYGYLMFRRDRRKRMRLFATPLFVGGSSALIEAEWGAIRARLLKKRLLFTLAEHRVLGFSRGLGKALTEPRSKMFRGAGIRADEIDYLYSELTLVAW